MARHPLLARLTTWRSPERGHPDQFPRDGWAYITGTGRVVVHPTRRATAGEWTWVFAHLLIHLGFEHHLPATAGSAGPDDAHLAACDVVVNRFMQALKLGTPVVPQGSWPPGSERTLAARWREAGIPAEMTGWGVAGSRPCVSLHDGSTHLPNHGASFAAGLSAAVTAAVDVAGGVRASLHDQGGSKQPWDLARAWFLSSFPLLGAVTAMLTVVADAELARAWDIQIAAVSATAGELYVNPHAPLTLAEWRFVIAHEALHAALGHHARCGARDPELYNIACDFVINGWLVEAQVGVMPAGLLHDPRFAGMSAEQVYDVIAREARRYRKLATLRGRGAGGRGGSGDVLVEGLPHPLGPVGGVSLDELLRRALLTGFDLHRTEGRGLLPSGLVAEIRALAHPPPAWDAALARWFDEYFPAVERRRTYGRASRRQVATPDIPRPGWYTPTELVTRRTFGVVLDTSMSMNAVLLGKALGAIASYSVARDVPAARVVYCDAAAYDAGYLAPEDIAGRVRVRGRGGTVLQPGVDLIERAPDFPPAGPVLVITDGQCDVLRVRREHAYLMPAGASLPFTPKGPVFHVS